MLIPLNSMYLPRTDAQHISVGAIYSIVIFLGKINFQLQFQLV